MVALMELLTDGRSNTKTSIFVFIYHVSLSSFSAQQRKINENTFPVVDKLMVCVCVCMCVTAGVLVPVCLVPLCVAVMWLAAINNTYWCC